MSTTPIIVRIDPDTSRRPPREFRLHAREAWLRAVDRAYASGRIETVIAEELRRAWPPETQRQ
jgi:hypothetical protein